MINDESTVHAESFDSSCQPARTADTQLCNTSMNDLVSFIEAHDPEGDHPPRNEPAETATRGSITASIRPIHLSCSDLVSMPKINWRDNPDGSVTYASIFGRVESAQPGESATPSFFVSSATATGYGSSADNRNMAASLCSNLPLPHTRTTTTTINPADELWNHFQSRMAFNAAKDEDPVSRMEEYYMDLRTWYQVWRTGGSPFDDMPGEDPADGRARNLRIFWRRVKDGLAGPGGEEAEYEGFVKEVEGIVGVPCPSSTGMEGEV